MPIELVIALCALLGSLIGVVVEGYRLRHLKMQIEESQKANSEKPWVIVDLTLKEVLEFGGDTRRALARRREKESDPASEHTDHSISPLAPIGFLFLGLIGQFLPLRLLVEIRTTASRSIDRYYIKKLRHWGVWSNILRTCLTAAGLISIAFATRAGYLADLQLVHYVGALGGFSFLALHILGALP